MRWKVTAKKSKERESVSVSRGGPRNCRSRRRAKKKLAQHSYATRKILILIYHICIYQDFTSSVAKLAIFRYIGIQVYTYVYHIPYTIYGIWYIWFFMVYVYVRICFTKISSPLCAAECVCAYIYNIYTIKSIYINCLLLLRLLCVLSAASAAAAVLWWWSVYITKDWILKKVQSTLCFFYYSVCAFTYNIC